MSMMSSATSSAPVASPHPVLLYVEGAEQRNVVVDHLPFSIGRKTGKDLVIPDSRVSRDHAQIICENGEYYLVDQNSRHGTFVNGKSIHGEVWVHPGEAIQIASSRAAKFKAGKILKESLAQPA